MGKSELTFSQTIAAAIGHITIIFVDEPVRQSRYLRTGSSCWSYEPPTSRSRDGAMMSLAEIPCVGSLIAAIRQLDRRQAILGSRSATLNMCGHGQRVPAYCRFLLEWV